MRVPIILPTLGTYDEPVRVNGWFIDEGDWVVTGDILVELLVAGITFDVAAESTGRLLEISKPLDSSIKSGETLGWIDSTASDAEEAEK
jgi:pyruvate/2-oxoglutarate dehydrogenase complex dihydrolipoamide acyltransferase (E2) component